MNEGLPIRKGRGYPHLFRRKAPREASAEALELRGVVPPLAEKKGGGGHGPIFLETAGFQPDCSGICGSDTSTRGGNS